MILKSLCFKGCFVASLNVTLTRLLLTDSTFLIVIFFCVVLPLELPPPDGLLFPLPEEEGLLPLLPLEEDVLLPELPAELDVFVCVPPFTVWPFTFACVTVWATVTLVFAVSIETFSPAICTFSTLPVPFTMVFAPFAVIFTFFTVAVPSVCKFAFAETSIVSTFPLTVTSVGEEIVTALKFPSNIDGVVTFVFVTVLFSVKTLTADAFFSIETLPILEFFNFTVWIPPPLTIREPFTVIFSNVTSPSPIPSASIKSLSITVFSNVTLGVLIMTFFPLLEALTVFSVTILSIEQFNNVTTSAREIGSLGWNAPSEEPLT